MLYFPLSLKSAEEEAGKGERACISAMMVDVWWSLLGAAIPAFIAGQAFRMKKKRAEERRFRSARGRERSSDDMFVCEEADDCSDACARTVCVNQHQVPNWNDICLGRCQSECLRLSSSHSS
ncbi:hypothetical protein REPUB_Repub10bG0092500 [Reevesia pubescens]